MSEERKCRVCGCTDNDCSQCIEKTGEACYWVEEDLCSACDPNPFSEVCNSDDEDDSECWLCHCGHYIEDGFHCPKCGAEPAWGCPCSECSDAIDDEDDFDYTDKFDDDMDRIGDDDQ